tara:strand:+ start:552 stop:767 length:216 start_codon:yes stop_codon:yes gene_type:complete
MVEIFRSTTNIPKWYLRKTYKSPLKYQKGEYVLKEIPKKKKPDSDTLTFIQKLRKAEQEERDSKKKKTRKR